MLNHLCAIILLSGSLLIAQETVQKGKAVKPGDIVSGATLVDNRLIEEQSIPHDKNMQAFPFWGHIQQYKYQNYIFILFPDNHSEKYEDGELKQSIKCNFSEVLYYTPESNKAFCSQDCRKQHMLIFAFKKSDLDKVRHAEQWLNCNKISIDKNEHGLSIAIQWDEKHSSTSDYIFSCEDCPYLFIETKVDTNAWSSTEKGPYIKKNIEDGTYPIMLVNIKETKDVKPISPCERYSYDLLNKDLGEQCLYYITEPGEVYQQLVNMKQEHRIKYDYLTKSIIYDYNLPHQ